jgi:hypothetical protein
MANTMLVNKEVFVSSVYFGSNNGHVKSFPKKIECEGRTYTFNDGLQMIVGKGNELLKVFCMSDGSSNYRILQDVSAGKWTLQSIKS